MKSFQQEKNNKNYMNGDYRRIILFVMIGTLIGSTLTTAIFYNRIFGNNSLKNNPLAITNRLDTGKYKFINPLLDSSYANESETLKWFPAERQLKSSIQDIIASNPEINTSVFFLNLRNSGWFGVNSADAFIPASLLKLPMLISYYKLREKEKDLFDQRITYQGEDYNKYRKIGEGGIVAGKTYTVKELMNEMIINSDNNALQLLYKYRQNSLQLIFDDLKISLPSTDSEIADKDFVTSRDIARFLLVLYNASYLSHDDSEEALKTLSQTSFKDGLVAGIPSNINVSHKFGERELSENGTVKNELHDCGIVYNEKIPYIVCIMTKGKNIDAQKTVIQQISKRIYEGVSKFSNQE